MHQGSLTIRAVILFTLSAFGVGMAAFAVEPAPPNSLSAEEAAGQWQLLFTGRDGQGWHSFKTRAFPTNGWDISEGWLHCLGKGGHDLISDEAFDDFELSWDWKISSAGNSGLKYFVLESRKEPLGHEYQMIDDQRNPDAVFANHTHSTACFYDVLKPEKAIPVHEVGETNHSRIISRGNHVEHWLNGVKVLDYNCGSEAVRAAVKQSKFKNVEGFGDKVQGHFLLQDHHSEVWFQNIKVRPLSDGVK